jgi:hypothetical protein
MVWDRFFSIEETDTSFSQRFVLPNQSVFHFTIVEAMFALDGNSYITKWHDSDVLEKYREKFDVSSEVLSSGS